MPTTNRLKTAAAIAEKKLIRETLDRHDGKMMPAAAELGVHLSTLARKVKRMDDSGL